MTTVQDSHCAIWSKPASKKWQESILEDKTYIDSPRAGGGYAITSDAEEMLRFMGDTIEVQRIKARLTTMLVERRRQGEEWPLVTTDVIEQVRVKRDLLPNERADRLLRYFAKKPHGLGTSWTLDESEIIDVMVQCECIDKREVDFLVDFLVEQGWFKPLGLMNFIGGTVTLQGYDRIADMQHSVNSARVFVAMWFDPSVDRLYDDGIRPAIEQAGYSPYVVNRDPSVNKIDDAIIAAIRDSRFMVADFTHDDEGVRGSVYFEAGFAYGIEIPVIHTCRQDLIKGLHFDTRQYLHIDWAEPTDLVERLRDAIVARVGRGPLKISHDGD